MTVNDEPMEGNESPQELENTTEMFPVGPKLSELVAKFRDDTTADRLAENIVAAGEITEDFYHETGIFSSNIIAATESDWEKAVGTDEEVPLQLRRQILHQVGLIVMLLDSYWKIFDSGHEDIAEMLQSEIHSLRDELIYQLQQTLFDETLAHRDYFESILQKLEGLTTPG